MQQACQQHEARNRPRGLTQITGVKPDEMPAVWPLVKEHFETFESLSKGEVTVSDLLHQVLAGRRQCWLAVAEREEIKACALTEIVGTKEKAVQIIFAAGRDRHEWRDAMVREIEQWAQSGDVWRSRIIGRAGWSREMKDYREVWRAIEKELR